MGVFWLSSVLIVKIPWDSCQRLFLQCRSYKLQSIIQTSQLWCTWSPRTRLFSKQVQQNVLWRLFCVANRARFHPSGLTQRVSEDDDATRIEKQDNIPVLKMEVQPHSKLVGVVESGQKVCCPHAITALGTVDPATWHAQHSLQQSWGLQTPTVGITHVLQVVILHTENSEPL